MNKSLKNVFISKALNKHKDKHYDYSLVEYVNSTTRVKIICPEHGIFEQTPTRHLCSKGCIKCSYKLSGEIRAKSKEDFIKECLEVHNKFYSYDNTIYKNNKGKIVITCPIHGDFTQSASSHLKGNGCKECAKNKMRDMFQHTTEEFKDRVYKKFGEDLYDLSKVKYSGANNKVNIVCKYHGSFETNPNDFLNKNVGCPACKELSKITSRYGSNNIEFSKNKESHLYLVEFENFIKVGITTNINKRVSALKYLLGEIKDLVLVKTSLFKSVEIENNILQELQMFNLSKTLTSDGKTECFPKYFKNYIIRKYFKQTL